MVGRRSRPDATPNLTRRVVTGSGGGKPRIAPDPPAGDGRASQGDSGGGLVEILGIDAEKVRHLLDDHIVNQVGEVLVVDRPKLERASV